MSACKRTHNNNKTFIMHNCIKKTTFTLLCFGTLYYIVLLFRLNQIHSEFPFAYNVSQDFQKIGSGPHKLYVYSAYYQNISWTADSNSSVIVVGGLNRLKENRTKLFCKFYDEDGGSSLTIVDAQIRTLCDVENQYYPFPYVAAYIRCNIGERSVISKEKLPAFVSIQESSNPDENTTNILKIYYKGSTKKLRFALCTQPLYNNYEEPLKLAEWIEFHRLMGVEKITLYNTSIGPKTSCLIDSYGDFIETLPWSTPYKFQKEIIQGAQLIMANECVWRYKGVADYLVILDRDEMIIPSISGGNNYSELFKNISKKLSEHNTSIDDISEYNFRNGFFIGMWNTKTNTDGFAVNDNQLENEILKNLQIVTQINRRRILEPHKIRSKLILVPDKVVDVSIHIVTESVGNASAFNVTEELAYSHHYRNTCPVNRCSVNETVLETSSRRFAYAIAKQIAHQIQSKAKHCNILT